ncbi:MAG: hypothetical protein RML94_12260 [Bacteroidia bacterium]|nr:hypothetical protein [Bacteroidia bacterium]
MGRSTEAIAQPEARRPCGHERSEMTTRTRPQINHTKKILYSLITSNSIRLFLALPSGVLLSAIGLVFPKPL